MTEDKSARSNHDIYFKNAIANPRTAKEFFEQHLPAHILKRVNLDTLKAQKESFLDRILGVGHVDALFSVQFDNDLGYLYLLVEQQSTPDEFMAFRFHKYMFRIIDNHLKKHPKSKHLPLIYPIIFYTGQRKYSASLDLWSLFKEPELAKSFFVEPFQLIELQKIDDKQLHEKIWAGVMQYVMKRIFEKDIFPFLDAIKPHLEEIAKQDFDCINEILCYTLEKAETEKAEKVIELFKEVVSEDKKGKIMSIADRIREEGARLGKQEGIQLGKQEGIQLEKMHIASNMLAKGQNISFISEVTGLSEAEIQKLADNKGNNKNNTH